MKLVVIALLFLFTHCTYVCYNLWMAKQTATLTILGIHFSSIWTFWLGALVMSTPLLALANYVSGATFYYAHMTIDRMWLILLIFLFCQSLAMIAMTALWFGEWPTRGTLVGAILSFTGLLIPIFWK